MKRLSLSIIGAALLSVVAFTAFSTKTHADKFSRHSVVVLYSQIHGKPISDTNGQYFQYTGSIVYCSSSSSNAPTFPQFSPQIYVPVAGLAQALADLLDDGYQIKYVSDDQTSFTLIKKL